MRSLLLLLCLVLCACDDDEAARLAADHPGWKAQRCETCHTLPVEEHTVTDVTACAECHGGNGACDPNASARAHAATDACVDCHPQQHAFTAAAECVACHFAADGVVACP